jgi:hypothetical protein
MDPADWPRARPRGDSRNPAARIRDISEVVGLREPTVQAIMAASGDDLEDKLARLSLTEDHAQAGQLQMTRLARTRRA